MITLMIILIIVVGAGLCAIREELGKIRYELRSLGTFLGRDGILGELRRIKKENDNG